MSLHPDRNVLFGNEAFTIGVLQAVSLATIAGTIAQFSTLTELVGRVPILVFITLVVLTLLCAIAAAYFRHQYKMYDVKRDPGRANRYLWLMRRGMACAVILLIIGFLELLLAFWWPFMFPGEASGFVHVVVSGKESGQDPIALVVG